MAARQAADGATITSEGIGEAPEFSGVRALVAKFGELINQLNFSNQEQQRINDALQVVLDIHSAQAPRKDGQPFATHPIRTALIVIEELGIRKPDVIISALLHDSVEDQPGRLAASSGIQSQTAGDMKEEALRVLQSRFGSHVSETVRLLTLPNLNEIARERRANGDTRKKGEIKNELYFEHVKRIVALGTDASAVLAADLYDNALSLNSVPEGPGRVYLQDRYRKIVEYLSDGLSSLEPDHILSENGPSLAEVFRRSGERHY